MPKWTVISTGPIKYLDPYVMAVFNSLGDAIEYVKWVYEYDAANYGDWLTYICEDNYFYTCKS